MLLFLHLFLTMQGLCKREESQVFFTCYPERSRGSRLIFKSDAKIQQFSCGVKSFYRIWFVSQHQFIIFCQEAVSSRDGTMGRFSLNMHRDMVQHLSNFALKLTQTLSLTKKK